MAKVHNIQHMCDKSGDVVDEIEMIAWARRPNKKLESLHRINFEQFTTD